ncbi:glycosyltransferase family 2 protein [Cytophagales bacterium LB-30]|uniref:Glycosyltransferase family 2 protein n=1 Tax=Shiella aurantiaca TaxID=3058365 RepID=A0ABT8F330_9BACT|nr:glycosyltransferase family 2 protein [Shiella aurantiaca]MDN4164860.1 glycosyltransferase family 2 protein [Shiella aurantiaca]
MKISGFTFSRNATKLHYPIKESILSILDIVDEFVVVLGDNDPDDTSREEVLSIGSPKIKIIDTVWDLETYKRGTVHAQQTDVAMKACTGDWLIYLQADEVIHEQDHQTIVDSCKKYLNDKEVEGLLFKYKHFWGSYNNYHVAHGWYPFEIRIVRNLPDVHSWESAQSFRRIPDFDGINYRRKKEGTFKLKVALIDAYIYHYGWVRPPHGMQKKRKYFESNHRGKEAAEAKFIGSSDEFDYGPMKYTREYKGTHPKVMADKIKAFDWGHKLYHDGPIVNRDMFKHERLKYRIVTWIEQNLMGGRSLGGFKNYKIIRK